MTRINKHKKQSKYSESVVPFQTNRIEFIDLFKKTSIRDFIFFSVVIILVLFSITVRHSIEKAFAHKPLLALLKYNKIDPKDVVSFNQPVSLYNDGFNNQNNELDILLKQKGNSISVYTPIDQNSEDDKVAVKSYIIDYVDVSNSISK